MIQLLITLITLCPVIINGLDYSIHIKGRVECLGEANQGVMLKFYTRENGKLKFTDYYTYARGYFDIVANRTTSAEKVEFVVDVLHNCDFSASELCSRHFNRTVDAEHIGLQQKTANVYDLGKIELDDEWNDVRCDDYTLEEE